MKKLLAILMMMFIVSGCGSTANEVFNDDPPSEATSLPIASLISSSSEATSVVLSGNNGCVENDAVVTIYDENNSLLQEVQADGRGKFQAVFAQPGPDVYVITAQAPEKLTSNSISFSPFL